MTVRAASPLQTGALARVETADFFRNVTGADGLLRRPPDEPVGPWRSEKKTVRSSVASRTLHGLFCSSSGSQQSKQINRRFSAPAIPHVSPFFFCSLRVPALSSKEYAIVSSSTERGCVCTHCFPAAKKTRRERERGIVGTWRFRNNTAARENVLWHAIERKGHAPQPHKSRRCDELRVAIVFTLRPILKDTIKKLD